MFPSSLSRDPALSLPSPSVQNQIHELAKTLPPPRKQNIACDACRYARIYPPVLLHTLIPRHLLSRALNRQRKVKCHQLPGQPKARPPPSLDPSFGTVTLIVPDAFLVPSMRLLPSHIRALIHTYAQHCMVKNYPCTSVLFSLSLPVAKSTFACLDTMRSRLPARRSASPP